MSDIVFAWFRLLSPPFILAHRRAATRCSLSAAQFQPGEPLAVRAGSARVYLGQVRGELTEAQKALIDSLISLEWSALVAEAAHTDLAAARESRESRRLFQRLIADFERSVAAAPRPVVDQRKLLNDYLARREAGEAA